MKRGREERCANEVRKVGIGCAKVRKEGRKGVPRKRGRVCEEGEEGW
jgi:hypothetical protein